jgi:CBS domain-containing protein
MRICEVMSTPVVTVQPDTQLKDVAATLIERGINAAPVIDTSGRLVGIVSEADLLSLEPPPGPGSVASWASRHRVGEVMSRSVYTLTEDTDATAAARMMLRHNLKSVPVVAGDQVVGIIARRDLLRLVARSDDDIHADLEGRLKEELDALQRLAVAVEVGVVTLDADLGPLGRQLVEGLARVVPGVIEVRTSQPADADRR